ncbi:MAG TPA: amidohydrolase family protein [Woeseiaceae bacterium]|nr:amidohydrolase family protein [Woeseiaceae bacterium]
MRVSALLLCLVCVFANSEERLPIIDVHMHALPADHQGPPPVAMCTPFPVPAWDPATPYGELFMGLLKDPPCDDPVWSPMTDLELQSQTIAAMEYLNVVGVLSGTPELVAAWMKAAPGRFFPGLGFQIEPGMPSPESLEQMHSDGKLDVLAEVTNQYLGIAPDDERMEPYWEIAEKLDIPVGIHLGNGPPGVIYLGATGYRARLHSALTLEEVLARHPRLRVYIMHAGFPMIDDLLTVLYAHPQVYVGVGVIVYSQPRPAFYRFLQRLVEAGYEKRVLFGSDHMVWPGTIERSIRVIEEAPFLSDGQKRDIFYNNAARFLRLSDAVVARHHEM